MDKISDMKYIFFGTPKFAAVILTKLIDSNLLPKAIVCNPDRPVGRKMIITPPPTKEVILRRGLTEIDVLQPEKVDDQFLLKLKSYEADFYLLAAYAKVLPSGVLKIPKLGILGVHPSLLPKFRGPSPIQSAILEGAAETGVALFILDEKVDHGPILSYAAFKLLPTSTYEKLSDSLANLAGELLLRTLPDFVKGRIVPQKQDETKATYTKKISTEDGYVRPEELEEALEDKNLELARSIDRKVRALNPDPGVFTLIDGKRLKFLSSKLEGNKLILGEVQLEGKKPVSFTDYGERLF